MSTKTYKPDHLAGLRRFAAAITIFNILGHFFFGFEQSWAQPLAALATAYSMELLLELVDAGLNRRKPRFLGGGIGRFVDSLLSAHITALAVAMLLYGNDRLWVIAFAAGVAIASKAVFRVPVGSGSRHFFNPSNLGITVTILVFYTWVGVAMPYHFTENLRGLGDWILPAVILASGSFLNTRFTRRVPLIAAWLSCFALQALLRHLILGSSFTGALVPMTGVAFVLYTFYMVTDPATTPDRPLCQVAFGAAVAGVYGLLVAMHVVFGLFFALSLVCASRGLSLYVLAAYRRLAQATGPVPVPRTVEVMANPGLSALLGGNERR